LSGAYARVLEGRLLVVGWRHVGERGTSKMEAWWEERARPYSRLARDKKGTGPKKLIFDFSKGILHRAMIKFEADPVLGYK
jgi:hypothetical protein